MDNSVMLEDGEKYVVLGDTTYKDNKYILLSNELNKDKVCIRKVVNEDNKVYMCRLEDEELRTVLNLFVNENKDLISNVSN